MNNPFLQGYMACLSIVSERGREIQAPVIEAFSSIGKPTNKELKKAGVDAFDIRTANAIREARICRWL